MESYRIALRLLYFGVLVEIQERVDKTLTELYERNRQA